MYIILLKGAIGVKVQEIPVWDWSFENVTIPFYGDSDEYMQLITALEVVTEWFFQGINGMRRKGRIFSSGNVRKRTHSLKLRRIPVYAKE